MCVYACMCVCMCTCMCMQVEVMALNNWLTSIDYILGLKNLRQ